MKTLQPVNQKSVYHSAGKMFADSQNSETLTEEQKLTFGLKALSVMNDTYIGELKRGNLELQIAQSLAKIEIRTIEVKNFDNIPIEEGK